MVLHHEVRFYNFLEIERFSETSLLHHETDLS